MTKKTFVHGYDSIISVKNLLDAWQEFRNGKRNKDDVAFFEKHLMDNIFFLHRELVQKTYCPSSYQAFKINDPKPRDIHRATVRDRLVHHAIYQKIYWFFDQRFIFDSYSCRKNKGTHRALDQFKNYFRKVSHNNTRTCWVLKCDIRKFFASIDHTTLLNILDKHIDDRELLDLLKKIIISFHTEGTPGVGLPLGNLTSQLLINIYMNEFDLFVKHTLKARYYIRYADDFVFLSEDKHWLEGILPRISEFLIDYLKLSLHPQKVFIKTFASGVDFLGWVHFADHRVLRAVTRKRMLKKLQASQKPETLSSYKGMLSHGNAHMLEILIEKKVAILPL